MEVVTDLTFAEGKLEGQAVLYDDNDRVKFEGMVVDGCEEGSKLNLMGVVELRRRFLLTKTGISSFSMSINVFYHINNENIF